MSTYWLSRELRGAGNVVVDGGNPILSVTFDCGIERVYCPDSDEYRITADVIHKTKELGAAIIAYSSTWCGVTCEAKQYAELQGVMVMNYAEFFKYLKQHGVTFNK